MAATLVESMEALTLDAATDKVELLSVQFKVSGVTTFTLELEPETTTRDVKKFAKEFCQIEPEHMRIIHKGREFKESDIFDEEIAKSDEAVQVLFTAGHTALSGGGSQMRSGGSTGQPGALLRGQSQLPQNPFSTPVRGVPGSKGNRGSRMSGRRGGMALIRKYGILMKRQEFREKAEEIGFRKYR
mmetsp:Transcript_120153/g.218371  ORF Transcript_120153/g.218371 Transcript_120153/m.218371 type:complete len:186 (+) Transcript_120153:74-631(+)